MAMNSHSHHMERYQHLGPLIREMRMQAGLTQQELAERLGLRAYQAVQKWESGRRSVTLSRLVEITRALGHEVEGTERVKALFGIEAGPDPLTLGHLQHLEALERDLRLLREVLAERAQTFRPAGNPRRRRGSR
jgi:transcriptional regulator with XRE-family HTH domain